MSNFGIAPSPTQSLNLVDRDLVQSSYTSGENINTGGNRLSTRAQKMEGIQAFLNANRR